MVDYGRREMKKKIKYLLAGVIVLTILGAIIINSLQPLRVDVVVIEPIHAQAYFSERGIVREDKLVDIYSLVGGEVIDVYVQEGQTISAGEVIGVVDSSELLHKIELIKVNNRAILARIDDLVADETRARDSQRADSNTLLRELDTISVQEQIARTSEMDNQQVREENIRLQNILIEQSQRDVQNLEQELERANTLYDVGLIPKVELEAAEQALEDSRTALTANEQKLVIINSDISSADQSAYYSALKASIQARIDSIEATLRVSYSQPMQQYYQTQIESGELEIANSERMVGNSIIKSHVSGRISHLYIDSKNVIGTATPVAKIRTGTDHMIEVFVSTVNIDDIQKGDSVELIFTRQNGDLVYTGTIRDVDDRAEVMVSALGIEERRVKVLIEPDSISENFRSGYDVEVRFVTYSSDNRVVVPRTAIFKDGGQSMVYVVKNGTVVATSVELGANLRTAVVIESGVGFNDVVIRNATQEGLQNGTRVTYE